MKFLKLTLNIGGETFINTDLVYEFRPLPEGGTILFASDGSGSVKVQESAQVILSLCNL